MADPSKLPLGTTSASLLILGTNLQYVTIPITITVSPGLQKMALSQGGFTFTPNAGGGVTPPQTFEVLNTGTIAFSWTTLATTLSGGNWLSISAAGGNSSPTSFGSVTVAANPAGLAPGVYYGLVVVSSAGTVNSPQQFEVVLNVLASEQTRGSHRRAFRPHLHSSCRRGYPSSQTFQVTNLNATSAALALKVTTTGGDWLAVAPDNGSVPAGASQTITVQPHAGFLTPGVYRGLIALQAGGTALTVNVLFVVVPSAPPTASSSPSRHAVAASCTPSGLYPVFTSLTEGFVIPASWPLPIEVQVVDDCGNPMTSGSVSADFSNGDPRLSLVSLKTGCGKRFGWVTT